MPFTMSLRRALPKLDFVPVISEHRLAAASQRLQNRDGFIYGARFSPRTSYLPYYAARPSAPHVDGWRTAGFRGAALWGASVAVSLVRNELPSLTLYYHTYLRPPPGFVPPAPSTSDAAHEKTTWEAVKPYLPYAPLGLSAWELTFGTGSYDAPPHAGPDERAWYEALRGPGLIGKASSGLASLADQQENQAAQGALLSAACLISLVNQAPRAIGAVFMGLVAGAGAAFGLAYELGARLAIRACSRSRGTPMQAAQAMQAREMRERMMALDDEALPAPLVSALWNGRTAYEPNTNYWSNFTQGAADMLEHAHDPRFAVLLNLRGNARPTRWRPADAAQRGRRGAPARQAAVPLARDMGDARHNVHALGRDAATRRSLSALLSADPMQRAEVEAAYRDIVAFIETAARSDTPFAARRHPTGLTLCEAARCALTGDFPPRAPQYYLPISAARSTYNVDDHGIVTMKTIAAVLWRALGRLQAVDRQPENTAAIVHERKEAFVAALASSIDDQGTLLCQGGQSQRMALVLQGFAPGVQVEAYDAPAPVAQFVTLVTERMNTDLTARGEPDAEHVRRAYDAAYLEGCALYQGAQREELRRQLRAVAQALHEVDWTHTDQPA